MEERSTEFFSNLGSSVAETRLCQSSAGIQQMKTGVNIPNPTLLVSRIPDHHSQDQITMVANRDTMETKLLSSSLLAPQVNHNRPWRSNSLTPPTPRSSGDGTAAECDMISNFGVWQNGPNSNYKLRSHSLTLLKSGLIRDEGTRNEIAGQVCSACGQSCGHGTRLMHLPQFTSFRGNDGQGPLALQANDDVVDEMVRNLPFGSGMRGLKVYLKKLRLHKYSATFLKYSYEEFLSLSDEILRNDGVTLGARGKILKSIEKIHRRPVKLHELFTNIEEIERRPDSKNCLQAILFELEEIILMPLKPSAYRKSSDLYRLQGVIGGYSSNNDIEAHNMDVPQIIFELLQKIFIYAMLGHASEEANITLYGLLHNAVKQECFNENQKTNFNSWIDKLGKVYESVTQPRPNDKRRSFRGDSNNIGRRLATRSGSVSSNHHGIQQTQGENVCQKRHSYAFQEDKMQVTPSTVALPLRPHNQDNFMSGGINRARSSSGLYQSTNPIAGSAGECNSRRESSMSNDSGYFVMDSRRTSEVDYLANLGGGLGYSPSAIVPSSPTDWGLQHPLITLHNYNNRRRPDQAQGIVPSEMSSASISDFLSMQDPIARRDSGMSTNSESSRRSSFFSASPVPPTLMYGTQNSKISTYCSKTSNPTNQILGVGSASSGCSESSTDSLLEQDLQNLALSVSQKGLE